MKTATCILAAAAALSLASVGAAAFAQAAPERRGDGRVDAIGREEHHRRERGIGLGLTPLCGVSQTRQQRESQKGRAANRLKSPSPRRVQGRSKVPV